MDDDRPAMQRYTHLKLPTDGKHYLRVAAIQPGRLEDDVHVTVRQIECDSDHYQKPTTATCTGTASSIRHFEALSYAWGPPEPEHLAARIFIVEHASQDSQTSSGWLPVGSNLLSALQHLRGVNMPRDMWIDAICINQDDHAEKSIQVARMGQVYQLASRVVVWLGPSSDGSDEIMKQLGELGLKFPDLDYGRRGPLWQSRRLKVGLYAVSLQYAHRRDLDNLYKFLCRAWFDRLWVRQEIVLAKQDTAIVQCGKAHVSWRIFCHGYFISCMTLSPRAPKELYDRGEQLDTLLNETLQKRRYSLVNLRKHFAEGLCSDPRDRIYAIREFLPAELRAAITPDYEKPIKDVYKDATIASLRFNSDMTILAQCEYPPSWHTNVADADGGPSWVPDWSTPRTNANMMRGIIAGLIKTKLELSNMDTILQVDGIVAGKIDNIRPLVQLSPAARSPPDSELRQTVCAILAEQKESWDLPYPAGGTLCEAYIRTLMQGMFQDYIDIWPLSFQDVRREVMGWVKDAGSDGNTEAHGLGRSFASLLSSIHSVGSSIKDHLSVLGSTREIVFGLLDWTMTGKSLFHTTDGLIGIAPGEARPGDEVCHIFGSQVLLVLRPIPGDGKCYHVIGMCFQYGTMEGQAVLGPLPTDIRLGKKGGKWVFTNVSTGDESTEDPRAKNLGGDLGNLLKHPPPKVEHMVDVDINLIRPILAARGVQVNTFNLV